MKKSAKIAIIIALCTLLTIVGVFSALIVNAWFSNVPRVYTSSDQDSGQIARIGMRIDLLFERLRPDEFTGTIVYSEGKEATFNSNAEWGTAANPYIISLPRHMINLYALQRIGYFDERYISKNYDNNGTYIAKSEIMPHFLVCDVDGTPICVNGNINGSRTEIQPIGNDEYPFIGVIGGAGFIMSKSAAWNTSVVPTSYGSGNWSSGSVAAVTFPTCTLTDNYRNPAMSLTAWWVPDADYSHPDVSSSTPLVVKDIATGELRPTTATGTGSGNDNYPQFAYHGKVEAGKTLSQLASMTLGWSSYVWDFTGDLPTLK